MSVPFLAFYGDWQKAPLFDLDYYATNADELDDSIAMEEKTLADAYATRPIGGVSEDYVSYLGSYYFLQDPDDMIISAFFGNMLKDLFALKLGWVPASGLVNATVSYQGAELLRDFVRHLVIPITTIVIWPSAPACA